MKKLLLVLCAAMVYGASFAQTESSKVDYDATIHYCITAKQPVFKALSDGYTTEVWDHATRQYIPAARFNAQYGVSAFDKLCARYTDFAKARKIDFTKNFDNQTQKTTEYQNYTWKFRTTNTVIGASLIGASAASYMLANSILNNKISKLNNDLTSALGQSKVDANEVKQISEDIDSNNKAKNTIGYICAGVSVVGVVVALSGLHKEYGGIKLAHNLTINDAGAGVNITKRF